MRCPPTGNLNEIEREADRHDFIASKAKIGGEFVGLVQDLDNWKRLLIAGEFGLALKEAAV
jgi:hypothetical protein